MKKIVPLAIILFMAFSIKPSFSFAAESNLIQNMGTSLKDTENPKRLEVVFNLTEPINLSQGSSNIIYEYFTMDSNGKLAAINYKKDKSWSGYLNSYDNYPSGVQKYSSGSGNEAYSDNVPAAKIYTSTKTGSSIDVASVAAVRITVLRADGSGEKVTIYSDGTVSAVEKIVIPVGDVHKNTGTILESTTAELPTDTILVANKVTSGSVYNKVIIALTDVKDFVAFEIKLESDGVEIQPDGKVKISIPIPENFDSSSIAVYRIENDGTKTSYSVTVTTKEGVEYVTFETEHFSTYVLADVTETETKAETQAETQAEKDETPKTGTTQMIHYISVITIISGIGIVVFHKKHE